jgi:hypothetical protein
MMSSRRTTSGCASKSPRIEYGRPRLGIPSAPRPVSQTSAHIVA